MTKVDCEDCDEQFSTKKMYITHVKSKTCSKSKSRKAGEPVSKRARTTGPWAGDPLALVEQTASPARLEELQGQIKSLTEEQKRALQEQISRKQRQVLQAIPYHQLSAKQKEILTRLSPAGPPSPPPTKYVTLRAGQPAAVRRGNVQIVRKVQTKPTEPDVIEIGEDSVFSSEPVAAEVQPFDPWLEAAEEKADGIGNKDIIISPSRAGSIRTKAFAKSMLKFQNVVEKMKASTEESATPPPAAPRQQATVKESCPKCKKIFSKSSLEAHMDAKHRIDCAKCKDRFLPEELEGHMRSEHELPRAACSVCGKQVYSQVLAQHMDIFHKAECVVCKEKHLTTELPAHVRTAHAQEGCEDCPARFETKEELGKHVASSHPLETCAECGQGFQSAEAAGRHAEEAHPREACGEHGCGALLGTKAQLEGHKEKEHPNPNKFLTFGGGMFMMMMVPADEQEGSDEESETDQNTKPSSDFSIKLAEEIIFDLVASLPCPKDGPASKDNVLEMCKGLVEDICNTSIDSTEDAEEATKDDPLWKGVHSEEDGMADSDVPEDVLYWV